MAFEPTEAELANMLTAADLCDWADLGDDSQGEGNPRHSFLLALGAKPTTKVRVLAAIPPEAWQQALAAWKVADAPPSAVLLASAGLVGTAAKLAAGIEPTAAAKKAKAAEAAKAKELADEAARKTKEHELEVARLASLAPVPAKGLDGSIKMSTVIDQASDREIAPMAAIEIAASYAAYRNKMGHDPRPEEDISEDQLAGLRALFDSGAAPYVDLAIWGPYGHRTQRKLKLSGLVLGHDGVLQNVQVPGPPNLESWQAGFAVFRTGCIMHDEISVATLELWAKTVEEYAHRYGPAVWALLYQTEVRARSELVVRIKRGGAAAKELATAAGGTHPFNEDKPWDWVFRQAATDPQFWRKELEEPALLILARVAKPADAVDGDAAVDHKPPAKRARELEHMPPNRPKDGYRQHRTRDGMMTHNRRGLELCQDFQRGACGETTRDCVCPRNPSLRHQCAKCLLPGHGADKCSATSGAPAPGWHRQQGSKGKGKGKNKSKRGQY